MQTPAKARKVPWVKVTCSTCAKEFEVQPAFYRSRRKYSKSGRMYCNRICQGAMLAKLYQEGKLGR